MLILYCKGESESESFSEVCTSRHNRWLVIDYVVIIHYFIQKKQPESCFSNSPNHLLLIPSKH